MGTSSTIENAHAIVLFDGVCNLCASSVQFIINRDPSSRFQFASLQSDYARNLLNNYFPPDKSKDLYSIMLIVNNKIYTRSNAALKIARQLTGLWPVLYIFIIIPRFVRDPIYNLISKNRYKLFGKKNECMIPSPELKARFIG